MNLYAYVDNDPVNRTDPSGLIIVDTIVFCHFFPEACEDIKDSLFPDDDASDGNGGVCGEVEGREPAGECDRQYQWCINSGPTKCLKTEGGKTQCQRCWERCNAGDSPSSLCKDCGF